MLHHYADKWFLATLLNLSLVDWTGLTVLVFACLCSGALVFFFFFDTRNCQRWVEVAL